MFDPAQPPHVPIHDRLGIEILHAGPDRVIGRMPVAGNTQPAGLLHGGASCVLAESLGSIGAALVGGPGVVPVGVDLNITHHRGVRDGWVTGEATPVFVGRTVATFEVVLRDDAGRRTATARLTCALRAQRP